MRPCAHAVAVVGEHLVHLLADLVAAWARARADRRRERAVGAELAERADALGQDPAGEAPPAGVEHRDRASVATVPRAGRDRDRQAVGGQHHRRDPAEPRRLAVGLRQIDSRVGQRRRRTRRPGRVTVRTTVP